MHTRPFAMEIRHVTLTIPISSNMKTVMEIVLTQPQGCSSSSHKAYKTILYGNETCEPHYPNFIKYENDCFMMHPILLLRGHNIYKFHFQEGQIFHVHNYSKNLATFSHNNETFTVTMKQRPIKGLFEIHLLNSQYPLVLTMLVPHSFG